VEIDLSGEVLVFALLERVSRGAWAKYRGVFQSLRYSFPIVIITKKSKGRVNEKVIVFLKRHEHVWINMYKLLGWEVAEKYEMNLHKFKKMFDLGRVLEALKRAENENFEDMPPRLAKYLKPLRISRGALSYDEALEFFETIKKKFKEYMEIPLSIKAPRRDETRLHKLLRTSSKAVLVISGTYREELLKRINDYMYELLSRGVTPVDYSYNSIIVAKKVYRYRGSERIWRSPLNLDPIEVLKGFASRYVVVTDVRELEFEKRDVGWGLKAISAP